jgi:hypothetical protein
MDGIDGVNSTEAVAKSFPAYPDIGHETSQNPSATQSHVVLRWLRHDIPFISMLLLALFGVVFRLPVIYWVILTPVFAVISIAAGWFHFTTRRERFGLVFRLALDWCALLLAIYLLSNAGVQGVLNVNATSLAMMTLLALGTFVAGVQARVWQISAVGGALFAVIPSLAWLERSPLLFTAVAIVAIALSGVAWWVSQGRLEPGGSMDELGGFWVTRLIRRTSG